MISRKCQPCLGQGLPFSVASGIESTSGPLPSSLPLGPVCLGSLLQTVLAALKLPTLPFVLIFKGSVCFLNTKTYRSWMFLSRQIHLCAVAFADDFEQETGKLQPQVQPSSRCVSRSPQATAPGCHFFLQVARLSAGGAQERRRSSACN